MTLGRRVLWPVTILNGTTQTDARGASGTSALRAVAACDFTEFVQLLLVCGAVEPI